MIEIVIIIAIAALAYLAFQKLGDLEDRVTQLEGHKRGQPATEYPDNG